MKVIFLDVDGVLNSEEFLESNHKEAINRASVSILKDIIDKTGAVVVLSSGWKLWFDENMMPRDGYAQQLSDVLHEYDIALFDKTPDFSTEEIRAAKTFSKVKAQEITAWLHAHKIVRKYVVLDDLYLGVPEINAHLVKTDARIGITEQDATCVIDMMNTQETEMKKSSEA